MANTKSKWPTTNSGELKLKGHETITGTFMEVQTEDS